VILTDVVFTSNTGPLKACVDDFVNKHADDKHFLWPGYPDRCIIDMDVYSKNRVLRTPLSFKLDDATKTPLKLLHPWDGGSNNILDAFVTNVDSSTQCLIITDQHIRKAGIPFMGPGTRRNKGHSTSWTQLARIPQLQRETVPVPEELVQELQALLDAAGGRDCRVIPSGHAPDEQGAQTVFCRNAGEKRECLVVKGDIHKGNNMYLKVHAAGQVFYCCHSLRCKQKGANGGKVPIGAIKQPASSLPSLTQTASQMVTVQDVAGEDDPMQVDGGSDGSYSADNGGGSEEDEGNEGSEEEDEEVRSEGQMELDDWHSEASAQMQVDGFDEESSSCDDDNGEEQHSSSSEDASDPPPDPAHMACTVIRELALMGPAGSRVEARSILSSAGKAAGGGHSKEDIKSLQAAASEWLHRSEKLEGKAHGKILKAANFAQGSTVSGCFAALAELKRKRFRIPGWIKFKKGIVADPAGPRFEVTAKDFEWNVDCQSSHARSLVLAARLLWPEERDKVYDLVRFLFRRSQACGLDDTEAFDKLWNTGKGVTHAFQMEILQSMSIMKQPFLRDTLPSLMKKGAQIAKYWLAGDVLSFWLDKEDHAESTVEYRLSFCTGDITSVKGEGIIHSMHGMRPFFEQSGNINSMADLLAEKEMVRNKLRFDKDVGKWRIFHEADGIWRLPSATCEPQSMISACIESELLPLMELERFWGTELGWGMGGTSNSTSKKADDDEGDEEAALQAADDASEAGSKRSRSTAASSASRKGKKCCTLSSAVFVYGQTPRHQAEILKMLEHKLICSFSGMQKPYLLCCPNGLVDLRTMELLGRPTPGSFVTQMASTEYDPEADIAPAKEFFEQMLPVEAYPDQNEIVGFIQEFGGYCLTRETNQQLCLFVYGRGANGKSVWNEMYHEVLGKEICTMIPFESLEKGRGQNNDSLHDAIQARLVTVEESNGQGRVNEALLKNLSCGEPVTVKRMYGDEQNRTPVMKLIFFTNDLPEFFNKSPSINRRMAFLKLRKIYVDPGEEQQPAAEHGFEELRTSDLPTCLIQVKDRQYFEKHVKAHKKSYLKFFVQGAAAFYSKEQGLTIPQSMVLTAREEAGDKKAMLEAFFIEKIRLAPSDCLSVADMLQEFKKFAEGTISTEAYSLVQFGAEISKLVEERRKLPTQTSVLWTRVHKKQMQSQGKKGMHWVGLKVVQNHFAPPQQH